jgi:membrane protein
MFQKIVPIAKATYRTFAANNSARRGAAIAFYTVTSIGPILLLVIAVAGLAFGEEAARGALFGQFRGLLGSQSADVLEKAIASASSKSAGIAASVIGIVTLLATASGVFSELRDALNAIWEAKPSEGLMGMARARLTSIGLVIGLGFLLMASLVVDAALKGFSGYIESFLPLGSVLLVVLSLAISFTLVTLLFAAILKFLPDRQLAWRDVIWGAAFTAFLFEIGKFLIGLYLAKSATVSSLGAAGALLAVLFWVYYTAQIFLFGASFTKAYARPEEAAEPKRETAAHPDLHQTAVRPSPAGSKAPHRRLSPRALVGLIIVQAVAAKFLRHRDRPAHAGHLHQT